jgi:hypothetical protein
MFLSLSLSIHAGGDEADEMADAESKIIKALGWNGDGLIASAETTTGG